MNSVPRQLDEYYIPPLYSTSVQRIEMPLRTRKRKRRQTKAIRRKVVRRKVAKRRIPIALRNHTFCERLKPDVIDMNSGPQILNAAGNLTTTFVKLFQFNQLPDYLQYQTLFDNYVIHKVVCNFFYDTELNILSSNAPATTQVSSVNEVRPQLFLKTDFDDVTPDDLDTLRKSAKTRCVQISNGRKVTHVLKPSILAMMYQTALTTGYGPKWGQDIDAEHPSVPHYGLKVQVQTQGYHAPWDPGSIRVEYKMYFTMKNND